MNANQQDLFLFNVLLLLMVCPSYSHYHSYFLNNTRLLYRGFVLSDPSLLPPTRQYNAARGSKVYIKQLGSQRDVDAEELMWNII